MNQFFYESRGKEKMKDLIEEGMLSQGLRRSGTAKSEIRRSMPKIVLTLLGLLGALGILLR